VEQSRDATQLRSSPASSTKVVDSNGPVADEINQHDPIRTRRNAHHTKGLQSQSYVHFPYQGKAKQASISGPWGRAWQINGSDNNW
jgi:hypothetical protein